MGKQKEDEKIEGRDEEVPREIDFSYVQNVFQIQYQQIDKSKQDALVKSNTIQTIRFLLNEYTRSRLIHYDRLNAFLLKIPSVSDISTEAKREGSLLQILSDDELVKEFDYRKDELFSPIVAQSTMFLLKELLKHPIKKTRVLNEHFPPIRDLLHEFEDKINPHKKENFKFYYHPSNLKNIALFLDKNPDLDIMQVFPLFYENDEFYFEYTDWLDKIQDSTNIRFDERQRYDPSDSANKTDFGLNKHNLTLLDDFLHIYLRGAKIPADIDADICAFLPKILHLELIQEIISFYEEHLPQCFQENKKIEDRIRGGITAFKCILEQFYSQNFISMGYLEFWNKLKKEGVPEYLIDSFILKVNKLPKKFREASYDVFWKKPFLRIQTEGKKTTDQVYFAYVQVLDAFFYFLSSNMKSYVLAGSRGRGFEELVAERIIKELKIVPQKIILHDPTKTDDDEDFRSVTEQNLLITASGQKIPICKVVPDVKSPHLKLGENFRWREIDLAFVYDSTLYILECKNHLFSNFSDFEPIILKRNLLAYSSSYGKRKLCKDERVRYALNMNGFPKYKRVRFMIVTGEECPFEFMLSYNLFGKIMRDFDNVHQKLEKVDKSFVSKTVLSDEESKFWFEEISHDLAEKKLQKTGVQKKQWKPVCYDVLEALSKTPNSNDGLAKLLCEKIAENLKKGFQMDASHFEQFFLQHNPGLDLIIGTITHHPVKLKNVLMTVFHTSLKYKDYAENPFATPAWTLKYCLDVVEIYFGAKERQTFTRILQESIVRMYKNIIVGGKGAGRYYKAESVDDLKQLIVSFDEVFSQYGIISPSLKAIKAEVKSYISDKSFLVAKMERIMKILENM